MSEKPNLYEMERFKRLSDQDGSPAEFEPEMRYCEAKTTKCHTKES